MSILHNQAQVHEVDGRGTFNSWPNCIVVKIVNNWWNPIDNCAYEQFELFISIYGISTIRHSEEHRGMSNLFEIQLKNVR